MHTIDIVPKTKYHLHNPISENHTMPIKIANYFYEIDYKDYDFDACNQFWLDSFDTAPLGGCSEMKSGDIIGRNYDWNYSYVPSFKVNTMASDEKFASIAIASDAKIPYSVADRQEWTNEYEFLPGFTLDGVNENGVYVGINIVPSEDTSPTHDTKPGKPEISVMMMPRLVLDTATSAKEIVKTIVEDYSWTAPHNDIYSIELHILIADKQDDYIIEFKNNQIFVLSSTDDNYLPMSNNRTIMTNFFLLGWTGDIAAKWLGNTDEEISATLLTDHAEGLERYTLLNTAYNTANTVDGMSAAMQETWYTKAVNETNPWYSELLGGDKYTIYTTKEDLEPAMTIFREMFNNRKRIQENTWQTIHTSIYDLENHKVKYFVQEQNTAYEFDIPQKKEE